MAQELAGLKGVILNPAHVETNIVRFTFEPKLLKDLKTDYVEIAKKMYDDKVWVLTGFRKNNIRAVTHRDVTRADCEKLVKSLRAAIKQ
jgi:threonine aldolase